MSTPDGFSDNPLIAEMERRCAETILVSQAVVTCADTFEQACEPRAPKPEWFGTGHGQWDSWMIWSQSTMSWELWRDSQEHSGLRKYGLRDIQSCIPVARTGYPAPVGWQVVGE